MPKPSNKFIQQKKATGSYLENIVWLFSTWLRDKSDAPLRKFLNKNYKLS